MKKVVAASMMVAVVLGLTACGGGDKPTDTSKPADQGQTQSAASATGGTSAAAPGASTSGSKDAGGDGLALIKSKGCIACHGQNLEGGVGPKLADVGARLSEDQIAKTIKDGRPAKGMPGGQIPDAKELQTVASYLAKQK